MSSNKKIVEQIEAIIANGGSNYVEAILEWCDRNSIDPEFAGNILKKNRTLKKRIKKDAIALNLLKVE